MKIFLMSIHTKRNKHAVKGTGPPLKYKISFEDTKLVKEQVRIPVGACVHKASRHPIKLFNVFIPRGARRLHAGTRHGTWITGLSLI